jgi:putative Ca2+/H+ antiporter (TMEM165/GDT1 family)
MAAVLAMRHPRLIVFFGAYSALIVMTILSAFMGHIVPQSNFSKYHPISCRDSFFVIFGLNDSSSFNDGSGRDELEEV